MIRPLRWILSMVAARATRDERPKGCACQWESGDSPCLVCAEARIDEMEREETRLRGELRAAIARAEKAERECRAMRSDLGRETAAGVLARSERYDEKKRAEKAEAQLARWRPVVDAAADFAKAWADNDTPANIDAQRRILTAVSAMLDAEGRS